jgi:hypothetical protein
VEKFAIVEDISGSKTTKSCSKVSLICADFEFRNWTAGKRSGPILKCWFQQNKKLLHTSHWAFFLLKTWFGPYFSEDLFSHS